MTRDVIQLQPEVEELLREIAAQPGSRMLRVPRVTPGARAFRGQSPVLRASSTGLSLAERHLIEVHREEVAHALRSVAWYQLAGGAQGRMRVTRRIRAGAVLAVPSALEASNGASVVLADSANDLGGAEIELLKACTLPDARRWPEAEALCWAAHRIVPSWNGRMIGAIAFLLASRVRAALETSISALPYATSREQVATTFAHIGGALELQGDLKRALSAHARSLSVDAGFIPARIACLSLFVQIGDVPAAVATARELEDSFAGDPTLLDEHVARFASGDAAHRRVEPMQLSVSIRRVRDQVGGCTGRLVDALQ